MVKDVIKVKIGQPGGYFEDYTDGLISANIEVGITNYEGPTTNPDVGILRMTSRNPQLDPNQNPSIKSYSGIEIHSVYDGETTTIFKGEIINLNVEYFPLGELPLITITATDIIGTLSRHQVSQDFEDYCREAYPNGLTLDELIAEFGQGNEFKTFQGNGNNFTYQNPVPLNPLSRIAVKAGDFAYDLITTLRQSTLETLLVDTTNNGLTSLPYPKYDENKIDLASITYPYTPEVSLSGLPTYKSDGTGLSYVNILIDDGIDKAINQITFNNISREYDGVSSFTETNSTKTGFRDNEGVNTWGSTEISLNTAFSGAEDTDATYEQLAHDIFEYSSSSSIQVKQITVDAYKELINYNEGNNPIISYSNFGTAKIIIDHDITNLISITKAYEVVGIKHDITFKTWQATYILKIDPNYLIAEKLNLYKDADITINANSGDTNFNFVATTNGVPNIASARSAGWSVRANALSMFNPGENSLSDITHFNLLNTLTWNYDYAVGNEDWYGGGFRYIERYINLPNYWWLILYYDELELQVTAAEPTANFSYVIDNTGKVTFTNTSFDNDTNAWNFGDGTTSTLANPTKTYTTTGTKTVTLTVDNGITTDTISKSFNINIVRIPVRWLRADFNFTRTRANSSSPWDKNLPTQIGDFYSYIGSNDALYQSPVRYTATTGTVVDHANTVNGLTTPWNASGSRPFLITNGYFDSTNWATITPVTTNSGNTETINVKFYIRTDFNSTELTNMTQMAAAFSPRRSVFPTATYYEQNKTYEKINIYFSDYDTADFTVAMGVLPTWQELGYFEIKDITNAEISNDYFARAMVPTRALPPQISV
jgi:PKD repeat protein